MLRRETIPGVFYSDDVPTVIDSSELEFLIQEARKNKKHRARICAHPNVDDPIHEMVICLLDTCYIQPHMHRKSESLHVIEGTCDLVIFDIHGCVDRVIELSDHLPSAARFVRLQQSSYHTLIVHSSHFLFHETTRGPLDPADTIFAEWAPSDVSTDYATYVSRLNQEVQELKRSRN